MSVFWSVVAGSAQLLLALWGAFVSLRKKWAEEHKWIVLFGFFLLAGIGVVGTFSQAMLSGQKAAVANEKLSRALENLVVAGNENLRLSTLNTEIAGEAG
jgi:hypothetical protein